MAKVMIRIDGEIFKLNNCYLIDVKNKKVGLYPSVEDLHNLLKHFSRMSFDIKVNAVWDATIHPDEIWLEND